MQVERGDTGFVTAAAIGGAGALAGGGVLGLGNGGGALPTAILALPGGVASGVASAGLERLGWSDTSAAITAGLGLGASLLGGAILAGRTGNITLAGATASAALGAVMGGAANVAFG